MIKAVIFDFDGTIMDTETLWYTCYRDALSRYEVPLPLDVFRLCVGTHNAVLNQYMDEKLPADVHAENIREQARQLFYNEVGNIPLRKGVVNYLDEAQRAALHIGLASSSSRSWVEGFLDQFQIRSYFEVIMTRDDVTNIKPDPELYLRTIDALQVPASEVIAFEDSAHGARAAAAAGIHCIVVPNPVTQASDFGKHTLTIDSMATVSLSNILSQLNL